eukprot:14627152-Alexandrium_andersonii.AAC.1
MSASLVGSEMCIRDRAGCVRAARGSQRRESARSLHTEACAGRLPSACVCLLYTSDAADDM